jgi:iron complex outermembrane receptor protein
MNKSIRAALNERAQGIRLLSLATAAFVLSAPVAAQEDSGIIFEEIVVLATKREQSLMEVPVAVSTLSGVQISAAGIKDVWDLQQNVPALIVGRSQTTTTSNFSIRSIGSTSNNFGVESSVGLYVDGVYRSRQSSLINDLIDVEAVEVLRGPQGTLFGKNTAAGAIAVRSVRPSQEQDAFVDVTIGDYNLMKVSAAANIPLSDNVAFRGTVFSSQRDGIVADTKLGDDLYNDRDRLGVRLQLAVNEPSDDFNMRIIADYSEIDETCCVAMTNIDSLYYKGALPLVAGGLIDPFDAIGSDALSAFFGGTVFTTYPYPQPFIDGLIQAGAVGQIVTGGSWADYRTALNTPPISQNEDMGLSLEFNKRLSDSVTLKSITAYRNFDTFDDADVDFSDVDLITRVNNAEQSSISQEFQLTGEFGQGSSWVAGAYYFGQDLDSITSTTAGFFLNDFAKLGAPVLQDLIDGVNGISIATGGLVPPATEPYSPGAGSVDDVKQDHQGYAVFGQVDFAFTDKFMLSLGARYTDETKKIDATYIQTANGPEPDFVAIGTNLFLAANGLPFDPTSFFAIAEPNVDWGLFQFDPFAPRPDVKDKLSDDQTTGTVKLSFFPSESTMLYASWATGFKAGGTNSDRININQDQIFQPETSESIEVGLKGTYGPVQVVATVYQTDFDDFQANSFAGGGFILKNAGDLTVEGVELELLWRPTNSTEIQAWYAHNEGTYNTFDEGVGWDAWVLQYGLWQNPPQGDPGCPGPVGLPLPETCSRSGDKLPYNPEDRMFLALTQEFQLSSSTTAFARLEYSYNSDQTTDGDNDPLTVQDSFEIINARLGFNFENINASLTLWGRNITDERYYYGSFDVPFSYDKTLSYPGEPATYGLTFRKNFD